MKRTISLMAISSVIIAIQAQRTAGSVHMIQRSEGTEMAPAPIDPRQPLPDGTRPMTWAFTGDHAEPPAHPSCLEGSATERQACTGEAVLNEIRGKIKLAAPETMPPASVRVQVDFDVNQFGDVKQVNVTYGGDVSISRSIITALYALPKFIPAKKEGFRTASHCSFSYAPALLFTGPPEVAPTEVDPAPTPANEAARKAAVAALLDRMEWSFSGQFEVRPAHVACPDTSNAQRDSCSALEVLNEIRSRLKASKPDPLRDLIVHVDFDVTLLGEVQAISVTYAGGSDITNGVMAALYPITRFIPAMMNGRRADSHCRFSYPLALLFEAP